MCCLWVGRWLDGRTDVRTDERMDGWIVSLNWMKHPCLVFAPLRTWIVCFFRNMSKRLFVNGLPRSYLWQNVSFVKKELFVLFSKWFLVFCIKSCHLYIYINKSKKISAIIFSLRICSCLRNCKKSDKRKTRHETSRWMPASYCSYKNKKIWTSVG